LFLADAHLRGPKDPKQVALLKFLDAQEPSPGGLVILGDLFDYLAGPNFAARAAYQTVLQALARWAPYHYVEGNHDFDLHEQVLGKDNALVHPAPANLKIQGMRFRVFHGDRTSPGDIGTRLLRRALQSTVLRFIRDRVMPDRLALRLALAFAVFSRHQTWPGRSQEVWCARKRAIHDLGTERADAVIFAHTHIPVLQRTADGLVANPGPALPGGSYLKLQDGRLSLHRFPDGRILPPGPLVVRARRRE
jgi:UDP-2,3-diacylglucosamine pyrophosphatase LpxH